jgi:phospholipase C
MSDTEGTTRRRFMAGGAAAFGAAAAAGRPTSAQARLIETAATAQAAGSSLNDIEHVVILMQENRSFDHYFGTMSGVRGFSDPAALAGVFNQKGFQPGTGTDPSGYMQPWNLLNDPPLKDGSDTNDITHSWPAQHESWNNGAMDSFIKAHLAADGDQNGPLTMSYFTRNELAFYYALADAFTVCDGYHCSVLGPTDPNRLMAMSAWIDPAGVAGGPVITTASDRVAMTGKLHWKTMPEALHEAGVSWKVYNAPSGLIGLGVLSYFHNFTDVFSITGLELIARGITPTYDDSFNEDVRNGTLPSVSWIVPPLAECEHPAAPPEWGEYLVKQILQTLVSNPEVWAKTVFLVVYDENGGFFDHVPPAVAPSGTAGEYLTGTLPSSAGGIAGPIGLGFRTPCLVISPFSAGGYKYSGTLDHTSTLRLIETRFGVEVPNLSAWRRGATGDFTGALDLVKPPVTQVPPLPSCTIGSDVTVVEEAVLNALTGTLDVGIPYPLPTSNSMPEQETTPPRPNVP